MNQIQSAALMLAAAVVAFAALAIAVWWLRRPRTAPAAPRAQAPAYAPADAGFTQVDDDELPF